MNVRREQERPAAKELLRSLKHYIRLYICIDVGITVHRHSSKREEERPRH
jgi:hypothetical protein